MFGLTNSWACELTPCAFGFGMLEDTVNDSCQCVKSAAILLETCLCCPRARTSHSRWYALLATAGGHEALGNTSNQNNVVISARQTDFVCDLDSLLFSSC
jgi:hypothetical protein